MHLIIKNKNKDRKLFIQGKNERCSMFPVLCEVWN